MSNLPQIDAGEGNLRTLSDSVWLLIIAANDPPVLFRNGDRVVWIESDDQCTPVMREITPVRLKHYLTRIIHFYRVTKRGKVVNARPPLDLSADLLARPNKSALPRLRRVVAVPIYAQDGKLHLTRGYNRATGLFYDSRGLDGLPVIEEQPSIEEIHLARELIVDELLGDFPFVGPAERAHAVAALLQPFVRPMILGPTPFYLVEKPTTGTGATLLSHVICYPALGRFPSAVTQPQSETEWRYAILSWLRDGPSVILIDNLGTSLESPALASVLTDDTFRDRVIGTSDALMVSVDCMWIATGIPLVIGAVRKTGDGEIPRQADLPSAGSLAPWKNCVGQSGGRTRRGFGSLRNTPIFACSFRNSSAKT